MTQPTTTAGVREHAMDAIPQAHLPVRVLHVEDSRTYAALIQAYILNSQPEATFDTVHQLSDITPERAAAADCAILDLGLPDASGLEALVVLRAMAPKLPIIVLTGFDDLSLGINALREGAEDYLVKNKVDGQSLTRAIGYAVERRRITLALLLAAQTGS